MKVVVGVGRPAEQEFELVVDGFGGGEGASQGAGAEAFEQGDDFRDDGRVGTDAKLSGASADEHVQRRRVFPIDTLQGGVGEETAGDGG